MTVTPAVRGCAYCCSRVPSSASHQVTAASGSMMSCRSPTNVIVFNRGPAPFARHCVNCRSDVITDPRKGVRRDRAACLYVSLPCGKGRDREGWGT